MTNRMVIGLLLIIVTCSLADAQTQSAFTGTWVTTAFNNQPNYLDLVVEGGQLTGVISRGGGEVFTIQDGKLSGNTATFRARAFGRRVTFNAQLDGGEITVTRSVEVLPGGQSAGAGIMGALGTMKFTAKRDMAADNVPRRIFGNWKLNLQKSKYEPALSAQPRVPASRAYISTGAGGYSVLDTQVTAEGIPQLFITMGKFDGKEYPAYNNSQLAGLVATGAKSPATAMAKAVNARTIEITNKNNGAVANSRTLVLSTDGNAFTETVKGFDAQGKQTTTDTLVFERQ